MVPPWPPSVPRLPRAVDVFGLALAGTVWAMDTVLVADADDAERALVAEVFRREAFQVLEASESAQTVRLLLDRGPALVALAEHMAPLDDMELLPRTSPCPTSGAPWGRGRGRCGAAPGAAARASPAGPPRSSSAWR